MQAMNIDLPRWVTLQILKNCLLNNQNSLVRVREYAQIILRSQFIVEIPSKKAALSVAIETLHL